MPGPAAVAIAVSATQRALLQRLAQRQTAPQRLVRRAQILLALAADPRIDAAADRLGLTRVSVRLWRDRWLLAADALRRAEQVPAPEAHLLDLIEQVVGIVAVACEPPEKSGRPISHWTDRELADEAAKRQIVKSISPRTVGRFLKRGRVAAAPEPVLAQQRPR